MLEKNKDYIEFSMWSFMATHKPGQCTDINITGIDPEYEVFGVNNPFDIPCDVVVIPKKDFERLQADNQHYREMAKQWEENYNLLLKKNGFWKKRHDDIFKLVGFSSDEEIHDYLVNEAECDTLHEAVSKLKDQVKYTCDEWKDMRDKAEALEKEIGVYSRALQDWKEGTGCPSPSAAKTLIESGASWHHAYNESKEVNKKFADSIKSWQNVTGYATPEDFLAARIINATPFDYTAAWQKAIGCTTPEQAKERIKALNERIDELEADYNHLLCTTGFESEGEIEDALDRCDHSTLRKALVDYEFDYEALLKLTGYKSEHDIRTTLNHSEQFVYETLRELVNSLKREAKFAESNWQDATGRISPDAAKQYIDRLKGRLNKIHGYSVDW